MFSCGSQTPRSPQPPLPRSRRRGSPTRSPATASGRNGAHRGLQRIRGAIYVGDLPANGKGARYLVADRLSSYGELNDLLLDYNGQIAKLGVVPASPAAIGQMLERAA